MTLPKAVREYIASITRKGGHARAKRLTAKRRRAIATQAARVRWAKVKARRRKRHKPE